ncbi:hypothetical protein C6Y40_18860 [Alteromonas alba]|uniref:Uncharacterized protein n=1 Tax=Alteromonas alba TaxID=2079529 RepID=A0A2S9V6K6_9ALTE|nr:hypothetical protein [Alteromonas alba]MCP4866376.1 hypothetical protein [Alteromonas sp.]PRO71985.1 hypothetical protein C6Y40_18860 [Alteromonas alba]
MKYTFTILILIFPLFAASDTSAASSNQLSASCALSDHTKSLLAEVLQTKHHQCFSSQCSFFSDDAPNVYSGKINQLLNSLDRDLQQRCSQAEDAVDELQDDRLDTLQNNYHALYEAKVHTITFWFTGIAILSAIIGLLVPFALSVSFNSRHNELESELRKKLTELSADSDKLSFEIEKMERDLVTNLNKLKDKMLAESDEIHKAMNKVVYKAGEAKNKAEMTLENATAVNESASQVQSDTESTLQQIKHACNEAVTALNNTERAQQQTALASNLTVQARRNTEDALQQATRASHEASEARHEAENALQTTEQLINEFKQKFAQLEKQANRRFQILKSRLMKIKKVRIGRRKK